MLPAPSTICVLAILFASAVVHAQHLSLTLDGLIAPDRQKAIGLDTLTPDQRALLASALRDIHERGRQEGLRTGGATAVPLPPGAAAQRATEPQATSSVIESQIDGDFGGWEGETVVKLANGQVWIQTEYHYYYHYAFMPDVLIYKSASGYKMKVEGIEKAVGVDRLR